MASKVDCVINFGRCKGQLVSDIYESNPGYLKWMLENCVDLPQELVSALEYHVL